MPTCKKCHVSLNDETIHCPVCGRVIADAQPTTPEAQGELAHEFLFGGKGLKPDAARAKAWAEKAAAADDPDGILVLHKCLLDEAVAEFGDGDDVDILDDDLRKWMHKKLFFAADHADERPPKCFGTASLLFYAAAAAIETEPERAFGYYLRAADLGSASAMCELGLLCMEGIGTGKDRDKAMKWLRKAASAGDVEALGIIGETLVEPGPSGSDFKSGLEALEIAARAGDMRSRGILGLIYRFGEGVKKNLRRAINLLSDAAPGHPAIQHLLGVLLWNGEDNVEPNLPVARKWMAMAAERDFEDSREILSKIDDAIALQELGITQDEIDSPNATPPAEEPSAPPSDEAASPSEADALRRENAELRSEVKRLRDLSEKFRSQLFVYTSRMEAERKRKLAELSQTKADLFKAARRRSSDPTAYLNLAKYFESAFGADIAFTQRAYKSLEECTSDLDLVWTALYNLATVLHRLLKALPPAEAYRRFQEKAGHGLEIARGNGKMTHANNALMAHYRDTYNGKEIDVEAHVEKGGDPKSPKFLRLYFGYDPKVADKIVVSHVGSHLPNYQTLTKVGGW